MNLSRFEIKKLYGKYNYNISFNNDITLIYGMNGCGKTTLLNMVTAIITASIYKLFSYDFEELILHYRKDDEMEDKPIYIKKDRNNLSNLSISFNGKKYIVAEQNIPEERYRRIDYIENIYIEQYPFLLDIKHEFNYVYLALNRAPRFFEESEEFFFRRKYFKAEEDVITPEFVAPEIRIVESLIIKNYMKISADINKISTEFRNNVLKKSTKLELYKAEDEIFEHISLFSDKEIKKISESYIKILDEFGLVTDKEKNRYEEFFKNCIENEKEYRKNNANIISFILQNYELTRIQEIVKMAETAEKRKSEAHKPLDLFLDTVNEFIESSDFDKKIQIDSNGRAFFCSEGDDKKLSIQFLSSGEKQLIVFFANLIFGVNSNKSGIFVVDEPELSLHLSWQKVFIEKALKVSKNVQFIFATHSPEIVGKYRNKLKKIERERAK
ncbi:MAG: AAA family ATPase [Butyrivibrio hungatei]|nr:AAA family ATPase [Butyrivibrio hungatei]